MVPTSATGMMTMGMMAARQVCRNNTITTTTSSSASSKVSCTASMEAATKLLGFHGTL